MELSTLAIVISIANGTAGFALALLKLTDRLQRREPAQGELRRKR